MSRKQFKIITTIAFSIGLISLPSVVFACLSETKAHTECSDSTAIIRFAYTNQEAYRNVHVVATDSQTHQTIDMGDITPNESRFDLFTAGQNSLEAGTISFAITGDQDHHDVTSASYEAITCAVPTPTVTPTQAPTPTPTTTPQIIVINHNENHINITNTTAVQPPTVTKLPATGTPVEAYGLFGIGPVGFLLRKFSKKS